MSIPKHVYLLVRGTGVLFINIGVLPILLILLSVAVSTAELKKYIQLK
jgi:hypothetical protein